MNPRRGSHQFFLVLVLTLLVWATTADAQSLGEAARRARAKQKPSTTQVLSNEELQAPSTEIKVAAAPANAQSLGEAARRARAKQKPSTAPVLTNEELEAPSTEIKLRPPTPRGTSARTPYRPAPNGPIIVVQPRPSIVVPSAPTPIPTPAAALSATSAPLTAADSAAPVTPEAAANEPAKETPDAAAAAAEQLRSDPTPDEIKPVRTRWRTYNLEGFPAYQYNPLDPYHQNVLKADYPLSGNWFLELNALNTVVHKSRRNLDFSNVFADQIPIARGGTCDPLLSSCPLTFFAHNGFFAENVIFGGELRLHDDTFVPSPFRFRINGVVDFKDNINAFNDGSDANGHLFDAFVDYRLADLGHKNFDLLFLRAGLQGFRSDFHGLVFNDVGLGGRLFGESKKNRLRYDVAYFKLFFKNGVSGFIDFSQPSRHQVAMARLAWDDFLLPGWNSEWTFHYNHDPRTVAGGQRLDLNTFYGGATFNGHIGRWVFNPAFVAVAGHADHLEAGVPVSHSVGGWMGLIDLQYPLDFWKFRLGYLYASGDSNPADGKDRGFDAISDGVALFGGPLSYWVGENIKFGRGDFVRGNSFLPSLRGANGAANYINPGVQVANAGGDFTLSPRVQMAVNVNYLRFAADGAYTNRVVILHRDAGLEGNVFVRFKPFLRELNENVVVDTGFSLLNPLAGLRDAFQSDRTVYSTFIALRLLY